MRGQFKTLLIILVRAGSTFLARGQQVPKTLLDFQVPYFTWGKGLGITSPDSAFTLNIREPQVQQFTLGLNKYSSGHLVKLPTEFTYELRSWMNDTAPDRDSWLWHFQIEAGI